MHKCLCECVFSVLLGIDLGVELLGHVGPLCLTLRGAAKLFSEGTVYHFTFLPAMQEGFNFSVSLLILVSFFYYYYQHVPFKF